MDSSKFIKDKIYELINMYPDVARPLLIKHFKPVFVELDNMDKHKDEILRLERAIRTKYDKLQDKYIELQTKYSSFKSKF